jgi:hypothetical protein
MAVLPNRVNDQFDACCDALMSRFGMGWGGRLAALPRFL